MGNGLAFYTPPLRQEIGEGVHSLAQSFGANLLQYVLKRGNRLSMSEFLVQNVFGLEYFNHLSHCHQCEKCRNTYALISDANSMSIDEFLYFHKEAINNLGIKLETNQFTEFAVFG